MKKNQTLSVSIVAKNEESVIGLALESVKDIADEIIVLDTGSTDKTKEMAKKYTNKVYDWKCPGEWNFAEARNTAGKYCTMDWIMILDCDESLNSESKKPLKKTIDEIPEKFWEVLCRTIVPTPGQPKVPMLVHLCHRLYRNKSEIEWKGAGHNYLNTPPNKRAVSHEIEVIHNRRNKPKERNEERNKQRFEHLTKVLQMQIKAKPGHPRAYFYLANTYRDYHKWDDAIKWYSEYLKISRWKEERYQAEVYLAECLCAKRNFDAAFKVCLAALEEDSERAEAEYLLGRIAEEHKRYNQAAFWYRNAIKPMPQRALFLEGRYYSYGPWDRLCIVYWKLRKMDKSLEAAEKALEYVPTDKRLKENVEKVRKVIENHRNKKKEEVKN